MKRFSTVVSDGKVMASGIKANQSVLAKRGLDEAFAKEVDTLADIVLQLNNEQEALKSRLKEKTVELNATLEKLQKMTATASKIVKIDMPQVSWKEFGITAKK